MAVAEDVRRQNQANVVWEPHPGSQTDFLRCPLFEVLFHGTRGPGKSDALLMDFAQHVGQGFGQAWRGILFRNEYKHLEELIKKSRKWFSRIFPGADFKASSDLLKWVFPDGEQLLFRAADDLEDYWDFHGHEYPWIGYDELTNWSDPGFYERMMSCCRSSDPGMPRKYRATTNSYGPGHAWVKHRFIDQAPEKAPIEDERGRKRCHIYGHYEENTHLMENDPEYIENLKSISDENLRKAWLEGEWDIVAGGMFDDVWDKDKLIIPVPELGPNFRLYRTFDWGSSKPFSVGWWARAHRKASITIDGEERTVPQGSLIRWNEYYGWNGEPNTGLKMTAPEIARKIIEKEINMGIRSDVRPGPADYSIYDIENGNSIAKDMSDTEDGVEFDPEGSKEVKGSGSRKNGWEKMRQMFRAASEHPWEDPVMLVTERCRQFIRTIPVLPRDPNDPEDVDTDTEDHIADESRYMALWEPKQKTGKQTKIGGL